MENTLRANSRGCWRAELLPGDTGRQRLRSKTDKNPDDRNIAGAFLLNLLQIRRVLQTDVLEILLLRQLQQPSVNRQPPVRSIPWLLHSCNPGFWHRLLQASE